MKKATYIRAQKPELNKRRGLYQLSLIWDRALTSLTLSISGVNRTQVAEFIQSDYYFRIFVDAFI